MKLVRLSLPGHKLEGQTMFEVVLALGFLSLVAVATLNLAVISLSSSSSSVKRSQADALVNEALEWIKNQKSLDWESFSVLEGTYCLNQLGADTLDLPGPCPAGDFVEGLAMVREATFSANGHLVDVNLEVRWNDTRGEHISRVVSSLAEPIGYD